MMNRYDVDTQWFKKLIAVTAEEWRLGIEAAKRCIDYFEMGGRVNPTMLVRSDRSRRTMDGRRKVSRAPGSACREWRRWNDYRTGDTSLRKGNC
ncbi:MAG: hypothetical protein D4R84_08140 [Rhodocyclaceae bacterium]|nr:MAG: hypothetical protein D4R84_08140 [Rhodocyclaceae bacterium]